MVIFSQQILRAETNISLWIVTEANHVIEQDRRQYDQSFKIDNGDFCKGHHFVITFIAHSGSSQPLVDFYNRMAFDFGTLGNHEFNYGLPYLKRHFTQTSIIQFCALIFMKMIVH